MENDRVKVDESRKGERMRSITTPAASVPRAHKFIPVTRELVTGSLRPVIGAQQAKVEEEGQEDRTEDIVRKQATGDASCVFPIPIV